MITTRPFITMAADRLRHMVFFAIALIAPASLLSAAQVEDRIIAIVNSDLIMLSDMKQELAPERERIQKEYRGDALEAATQDGGIHGADLDDRAQVATPGSQGPKRRGH